MHTISSTKMRYRVLVFVGAAFGFGVQPGPMPGPDGAGDACPMACLLDCDSGSCSNWYIHSSVEDCDVYSRGMGSEPTDCGACKGSLTAAQREHFTSPKYNGQLDSKAGFMTLCTSAPECGRKCTAWTPTDNRCVVRGNVCESSSDCCAGLSCSAYYGDRFIKECMSSLY
uniref:Uncharacterized protein n=1 Tax=Calcidiscus leptoporus TaxID=127549 RepID=A0A7S0IQS0_9EUKA